MGALRFLTDMGLFIGQSPAFFAYMTQLAQEADAARRGVVERYAANSTASESQGEGVRTPAFGLANRQIHFRQRQLVLGCLADDFLFHKNAFRGTIHCSAEVAQHRWLSGFPSDAGHSMHRVNSILMHAPKMMIFETAANLELWPKILPHYRYIRFLERGHDRNLVDHGSHAFRHSNFLDLGANHRPRPSSKFISII